MKKERKRKKELLKSGSKRNNAIPKKKQIVKSTDDFDIHQYYDASSWMTKDEFNNA